MRTTRLLVAMTIGALALSACGGSATTPTTTPTTDSTEAPESSASASAAPPTGGSVQDVLDGLEDLSGEERTEFLAEQAAATGPVIIYTSSNPGLIELWQAAINEAYPEVDFQLQRVTSGEQVERFIAEADAGQPVASVLETVAPSVNLYLEEDLLARYHSPSAADFNELHFDPEGYWTALDSAPMVIAWNTDRLAAANLEAPSALEDLLDPAYTGQLGRTQPPSSIPWIAAILEAYGEDEGRELIENLAAQDVRIFDSNSALTEALASGQLTAVWDTQFHGIERLIEAGAPVAYVVPDPVFTQMTFAVVASNAPNPYGAALYIDWLLSPEGGQAHYDAEKYLGNNPNADYEFGDVIDFETANVVPYTPALVEDAERFEAIWEELFQQ